MKRLNILAAMGICMLTLTACGGQTKSEDETVAEEKVPPPARPTDICHFL